MIYTKEDGISVFEEITQNLNAGMGRKLVCYTESSKYPFGYTSLVRVVGTPEGEVSSEAGDLKQELKAG